MLPPSTPTGAPPRTPPAPPTPPATAHATAAAAPNPQPPPPPFTLRVATWNCQGIVSADRLQLVTHSLLAAEADVVLLQETNLSVESSRRPASSLQLPADYVLAVPSSNATPLNRGKGVAVLVSPKVAGPGAGSHRPVLQPLHEHVCASFELLAVKVGSVTFVSVYVHANHQPDLPALRAALAAVPGSLDPTSNVVVGGDWNHPHLRHRVETDVLFDLDYQPLHDPAAPLSSRGNVALDLLYYRGPDLHPQAYFTRDGDVSDHKVVVGHFTSPPVTFDAPPAEPIVLWDRVRALTGEQLQALADDVQARLLQAANSPHPVTAASEALTAAAAQHLGTKPVRLACRVAWWTPALEALRTRVSRAAKAQRRRRHRNQARRRYQRLRREFRAACQAARRQAAASLRTKAGQGNVDIAWLASHNHRGKKHPRYLRRTGPDPQLAQECWAGVFSDPDHPPPEPVQPDPNLPDLWDDDAVIQAVHKLHDRTPGPDGLRALLLKQLFAEVDGDGAHVRPLALALATCFNNAARRTLSPQAKTSTTVLIPKPGGPAVAPTDYRPIALQPVLTKLVELLVAEQVWEDVDNGTVPLSDDQGGFRANRSRHDLIFLLRCLQDHYHPRGRRRSQRRRPLYAAFLDLRKAYDSVPHALLIAQLQRLGVNPHLVRVVTDLLTARTTTVLGLPVNVSRGVPQGGPLSPLLFVLYLQSLSEHLAPLDFGGGYLPGDLFVRVLLYADDIALVAETPEQLQALVAACEEWAASAQVQMTFNADKSKLLVLAGQPPADLPQVHLSGATLEWVRSFKYLGSRVYASNSGPAREPFDPATLQRVVGPLFPFLTTRSTYRFHLKSRVQILRTMTENTLLHNAPVSDFAYKQIDRAVNKWLGVAAGCPVRVTRATFLRCDLGVLPSQLVAERDALYFLWHLLHLSWFRNALPALTSLPPVSRLVSLTLKHDLDLAFVSVCSREEWHSAVQRAVVRSARTTFAARPVAWVPNHHFVRSHRYLKHKDLSDVADVVLQLRNNRLPSAPHPWVFHPCPFCAQAGGLHGRHLLSCESLPPVFDAQRGLLSQQAPPPALNPLQFAATVLECDPKRTSSLWLRQSILFGRRLCRAAVVALDPDHPSAPTSVSSAAAADLFDRATAGPAFSESSEPAGPPLPSESESDQ